MARVARKDLAAALEIDQALRRASLVTIQLFGLALVRYIVQLEPVASATVDELAGWVGPNLQRYFTADLKSGGRTSRGHRRRGCSIPVPRAT